MEECRCRGVDGTSEQHETISEDVCSKAKYSVTINASVLKVDTSRTIWGNNYLELKCNG